MTSLATADRRTEPPSAAALLRVLADGSMSATEAMELCLSRIEDRDGSIRAFVDLDKEGALAAARSADAVPRTARGPLHGLPVAVKEVFDVKGLHCCWGSPIHRDRVPLDDAVVVRKLREAGAIVVGTAVSTEYAIAAAGPTVNPRDRTRTPGGSSSGPAAAVATGMVPVALGSQTVGSIVRPAAYCGVFGLKPTRGAIPGRGGMPLSPRLDHPGFFTRAAEDLPPLCRALFGHDPRDDASLDIAPPAALPDRRDLRILVSRRVPPDPVSAESEHAVDAAVERLKRAGSNIEPFEFAPAHNAVFDLLHTIMTHDMALAHGEQRDRNADLMSERLRALIDHGRTVTQSQYDDAVSTAERWRSEYAELLGDRSVILSPATDGAAPPMKQGTGSNRPQALWSLTGLPVVAIPCAEHRGLPLGVQVGAGPGREDCVIAVAEQFSTPPGI